MTTDRAVNSIQLPTPRYQQLKTLAEKRQKSIADTVGDFINEAIAKGELPDETPGLSVEVKSRVVNINAADFQVTVPHATAKKLAETLKALSSGPSGMTALTKAATEMAESHRKAFEPLRLVAEQFQKRNEQSLAGFRSISEQIRKRHEEVMEPLRVALEKSGIAAYRKGNGVVLETDKQKLTLPEGIAADVARQIDKKVD